MNKTEFATLAIGIKAAYPASKILDNQASMQFWFQMLEDIPYDVAQNSIMEHVCTNIYPPNIAEIRKLCADRTNNQIASSDDAWGMVVRAIREYGYNNPHEAFDKLDDISKSIVKNMGWRNICQSTNPTADRANFRKAYEQKAADMQKNIQLPKFVAKEKIHLIKQYNTEQITIKDENLKTIEAKPQEHGLKESTKQLLAEEIRRLRNGR